MKSDEHSKLLTQAGRRHLRPLGVMQRGRSRTWIDDHGWFAVVVEFQPSSWARGAYLNVGVCWLWVDKDYWSFDIGYRISPFREYLTSEQFAPQADDLALAARAEVLRYREMLPSVEAAYRHLSERVERGLWDELHVATAAALMGRTVEAVQRAAVLSERIAREEDHGAPMALPIARDIAAARDSDALVSAIHARIHRARAAKKMPTWEHALPAPPSAPDDTFGT